jgi:hypothetical protein
VGAGFAFGSDWLRFAFPALPVTAPAGVFAGSELPVTGATPPVAGRLGAIVVDIAGFPCGCTDALLLGFGETLPEPPGFPRTVPAGTCTGFSGTEGKRCARMSAARTELVAAGSGSRSCFFVMTSTSSK